MKRLLLFFAVVALCATSFGNLALTPDDMGAPFRGAPGSTVQVWTFDNSTPSMVPVMPDINMNPIAPAVLFYYPGATNGWLPDYEGRIGVVPLSGALVVDIPNFETKNPLKIIQVQVVWAPETRYGNPEVTATMADGQSIDIEGDLLNEMPLVDGFFHSTFLIHLEPNPQSEQLLIGGSIVVDQLIIDTICIPEPATVAILGIGMLFLKRRK